MSQLLAVTGNSGKTILSYFLAEQICDNNRRVVLISTDGEYPTWPMLLPPSSAKAEIKSLGKVLSSAVISQECILHNLISSSKNRNLAFLSYSIGETAKSYPEMTITDIENMFSELLRLVDIVVVDTCTRLNPLDRYAVSHADREICITSADYKGLAYRMLNERPTAVQVLNNISPYNPLEDMRRSYRLQLKYTIPYCKQLESLYNGALLSEISTPKPYKKVLDKLLKEAILNE